MTNGSLLAAGTTGCPPRQAHRREGPLITARTSVTAVLMILIFSKCFDFCIFSFFIQSLFLINISAHSILPYLTLHLPSPSHVFLPSFSFLMFKCIVSSSICHFLSCPLPPLFHIITFLLSFCLCRLFLLLCLNSSFSSTHDFPLLLTSCSPPAALYSHHVFTSFSFCLHGYLLFPSCLPVPLCCSSVG